MLRGKIKTWSFKLSIKDRKKINTEYFKNLFNMKRDKESIMDYIEYTPSTTTLIVTRNPYGFVNKQNDKMYRGVYLR